MANLGTIEYKAETNEFIIESKYDSKLVSQIKRCDGAKWDSTNRIWTVPAQPYAATAAKNTLEAKDELTENALEAIYLGMSGFNTFLEGLKTETSTAIEIKEEASEDAMTSENFYREWRGDKNCECLDFDVQTPEKMNIDDFFSSEFTQFEDDDNLYMKDLQNERMIILNRESNEVSYA